jgi:hypothetical protein
MYLSGSTKPGKKLQKIYDEAQELYRTGSDESREVEFFKTPAPSPAISVNEKQISPGSTAKPSETEDRKSSSKPETSSPQASKNKLKTRKSTPEYSPEPSGEKKNLESAKKISELKSNPETEDEKTSKKTESKSQKSLFDF